MVTPADTRRASWPPNLLSLSRVPLAAVLWVLPPTDAWLIACLATAAITDWMDGWLARWLAPDVPHPVGAWLDPVCDKVFVASAAAFVLVQAEAAAWVAPVLLAREVVQLPLMLAYARARRRGKRYDFTAGYAGKATTVLQFAAIAAWRLWPAGAVELTVAAGALGVVAVALYARRAWRISRAPA